MQRIITLVGIVVVLAGGVIVWMASNKGDPKDCQPIVPPGMVWIPGGTFTMGSDHTDARPPERPPHQVRVDGFFIDATEVTNAQFAKFVEATKYVTVAERTPTLEEIMAQCPPGTPPPPKESLVPGSLVFNQPKQPVSLRNHAAWWAWTPGANWRCPEGPGSTIEGKDKHPVVHVNWADAVAYAKWAGKRLPTEAEWERAARGGLDAKNFVWGDEPFSEEKPQANIWQGEFPNKNTLADGYLRTAPVASYEPNGYGLYDMSGNVWEWCSDWYRPDTFARDRLVAKDGVVDRPKGPKKSYDPREPYSPSRVTRGGSFLCADVYCKAYRASGRRGTAADTGLSHVGFRCVWTNPNQE